MFFLQSEAWNKYFKDRTTKILLLGLDDAGKKTILRQLHLSDLIRHNPLIGFNPDIVEYKGFNLISWDYTADSRIRAYWRREYFPNTQGIIYVVDSSNSLRLEENLFELHQILKEEKIKDSVLLIFLNKQDCENVIDSIDFEKKIDAELIKNRTFKIQKLIATTGEGFLEGLNWLGENINQKYK